MKDTSLPAPAPRLIDHGLKDGVWQVTLPDTERPTLVATHRGAPVPDLSLDKVDAGWRVSIPLPPAVLSDGMQTVVLGDGDGGATRATLSVAAGKALSQDLAAEIALLRAELDLLKRAFRTHCADTAP